MLSLKKLWLAALVITLVCASALPVQATGTNGSQDTLVDTPDNLDVVWARAANKNVVLHSGPSETSDALDTLNKGDTIKLVGEREVDGEKWYAGYIVKKTSPVDGWVRAKDMWFSDVHDIGFYPKSHLLYDRLRTKLNRYVGNWPDMTRKILGREREAKFGKGNGSVIHTLSWPGLKIVYQNSYKRPEGAWINYINVVPGRTGDKVRFGPIHLGSSIDEVRALGKHLGFEYKYLDRNTKLTERLDEVDTPEGLMIQLSTEYYGNNGELGSPYSFSFFIKDDKVVRMEYRWAYSK